MTTTPRLPVLRWHKTLEENYENGLADFEDVRSVEIMLRHTEAHIKEFEDLEHNLGDDPLIEELRPEYDQLLALRDKLTAWLEARNGSAE